jgi:branched-chain amino acid transport system permease protein
MSLGQTAFYGIGGYVGSIAAINLTGLTGNTLIWALPVGTVAGALVAGLIGSLIFYGRMGPLQTTILTYTFTLLLWTGSVSFTTTIGDAVVGGDNGMANIPGYIVGFGSAAEPLGPNGMFLCVLAVATIVFLLVQVLMRSPFGTVIDCIRLNGDKAELLGYDVRRYQLAIFTLSGGIAGIAGALYGGWSNYLSPSIFSVQEALLVPIYVLVGGLGTLVGPFLGALVVGGLSFWLGGGVIGGQTTLVMGVCLVLLVLFMKGGIIGTAMSLMRATARGTEAGLGNADANGVGVQVDFKLLEQLRGGTSSNEGQTLETRNIVKSFGGVTPVNHVSQTFTGGRVNCLIGPNGAGKSSFLRCCTGSYPVDEGQILLSGNDVTTSKPFERVRAGVGIKMQVAQVFDELDVRTNLWVAAYSRLKDADAAEAVADQMLSMLAMKRQAERPASELSHGEQQWLDIGMVLCLAPSVLLLDEPAAGMTREERRELSRLVRALANTATVIVVEHDMEFVRTLDAKVTVLHQGSVFAEGNIEDLRNDERILDIYLGRRQHVRDI